MGLVFLSIELGGEVLETSLVETWRCGGMDSREGEFGHYGKLHAKVSHKDLHKLQILGLGKKNNEEHKIKWNSKELGIVRKLKENKESKENW